MNTSTQPATRLVSRLAEAALVGAGGFGLGWWFGGLAGHWLAVVFSAVGALNGVLSGWRGVYPWRSTRGWLAFVLDSTWAGLPVFLSLVTHAAAAVSHGGYIPELSVRQARHVYRGGARLQSGMALTVGNVISNAGDVRQPTRRSLIVHHEAVHVWQNRWFGPLYLVTYIGWTVLGSLIGVLVWLRRGRTESLQKVANSYGYYLNPFEWWAYSRDDYWPPHGLLKGVGWKRPAVRPFLGAIMNAEQPPASPPPAANDQQPI